MNPCQVTVFTSEMPSELGKTFEWRAAALHKTTAGQMIRGAYEKRSFTTVHELVDLLTSVELNQALSASVPSDGTSSGRIVTKAAKDHNADAVTRSKDHFTMPSCGAGLVTLDYDPDQIALGKQALWEILTSVCPDLRKTGVVWWCSGSSHIYLNDVEVQGLKGQRFYFVAQDGGDLKRFGETLLKRLWLAGHGRVDVSSSGSLLIRGLFDQAMFQPARLDFIGGSVCRAPLSQRRGRPSVISEGPPLDTAKALPDLTSSEEERYVALVADAREVADSKAQLVRAAWVNDRVSAAALKLTSSGVSLEQAKERATRTLQSAQNRILMGDFELTLEDGQAITVGEILDNKEKYNGALCLDPLNPNHRNRSADGKLYLYGAAPTIFSFDDGGITYRLRRQPLRLYLRRGCKAELATELLHWLSGEPDIFRRGGVLVQVADNGVKTVRKHRLTHLVGSRVALYQKNDKGVDIPIDVPSDVIDQLAELAGG